MRAEVARLTTHQERVILPHARVRCLGLSRLTRAAGSMGFADGRSRSRSARDQRIRLESHFETKTLGLDRRARGVQRSLDDTVRVSAANVRSTAARPYAAGFKTTLMQPSFLSRNVSYIFGASSRLTLCVITNEGSISPPWIFSRSGFM